MRLLQRALADPERGLGYLKIQADEAALRHLAKLSDGDARKALNALEIAALTTAPDAGRRDPPRPGGRRAKHPEEGGGVRRRGRALRHDLGVHQVHARQRPGRRAVLAGQDDSRRRRPALHRAADCDPRGRRRRAGRPDGAGAGQRRVSGGGVHRLAGGADSAGRGDDLHRHGHQEQQHGHGH